MRTMNDQQTSSALFDEVAEVRRQLSESLASEQRAQVALEERERIIEAQRRDLAELRERLAQKDARISEVEGYGREYIERTDPILDGMEKLSDDNADLRQQLATAITERDAIKRTREQEEQYDSMCYELQQYRAALGEVRGERPIVQSALNDIGTYTEVTELHEVLAAALIVRAYAFDLQITEAAWRNAKVIWDIEAVQLRRKDVVWHGKHTELVAELERVREDGRRQFEGLTKDLNHLSEERSGFREKIHVAEARVRELDAILREVTQAIRDVLWCALVWNDHNHDFEDLTEKARSAARALGYTNQVLGGGIERANAWMQRVDAAVAPPLPADIKEDTGLSLTGAQVNAIREFTDGDPQFEIILQELPERTASNGDHMRAGLYCWSAEYPEEGVLFLDDAEDTVPADTREL